MAAQAVQIRRLTREEFDRLVASGFFHPEERLELIEGELIQMTPQGSAHASAIRLIEEALRTSFGTGHDVRVQMPLALLRDSEPEPDVAVVVGSARTYRDAHPNAAVLVVEVADATLEYDRGRKADLYARAGIPELWILNLSDRRLEVSRDPGTEGVDRARYRTHLVFAASDSVAPLGCPGVSIAVSDLLP
ncbi:MAG: Uma2 family endonuclease [Nitrospirae bacterium]|nr:Uma2 family endonuclease [Nitrospirota bacterium]